MKVDIRDMSKSFWMTHFWKLVEIQFVFWQSPISQSMSDLDRVERTKAKLFYSSNCKISFASWKMPQRMRHRLGYIFPIGADEYLDLVPDGMKATVHLLRFNQWFKINTLKVCGFKVKSSSSSNLICGCVFQGNLRSLWWMSLHQNYTQWGEHHHHHILISWTFVII